MNIIPIRTEADYDAVLARIDTLMDAKFGTPEGDELDVLVTLVEACEAKHYPMLPCDPIEAIKFRMDQMGLELKDLTPIIGSRSKVSEVLNHKRKLSINMIRNLHKQLTIPYESLMNSYAVRTV
ncbi:MAG: DNA-binding protein [Campylobacteraceae bacterium]|nr:DNA-binding protein [Campylobacteraceae bacterium]